MFKLTTKTLIINTNVIFNLDVIFEFFKCDDVVSSIKYNNQLKTLESISKDQKSFFNQITFKFSSSGTNVKIFKNNKIQITGVKSLEEASEKVKYLLNKIKDIRGRCSIDLRLENNMFIDKDGVIYNKNNYNIIGKKLNNNYYMLGKNEKCIFDEETGFLISNEYKKCVKNIYFYNGEVIGKREIKFVNKKYYLKKGAIINDKNEIIKYGAIVGNIVTSFFIDDDQMKLMKQDWLKHRDNDMEYKSYIGDLDFCNLKYETKMTNYICDTGMVIDREEICKKLSAKNYRVYFDPWMYKGVNLKLFFNEDSGEIHNMSGTCECKDKCICSKISLLIFRTGKIIVSSSVSQENEKQAMSVVSDVISIIKTKF